MNHGICLTTCSGDHILPLTTDEVQLEKSQAEQAGVEKAKRREVKKRKREQAGKAADLVAQQSELNMSCSTGNNDQPFPDLLGYL